MMGHEPLHGNVFLNNKKIYELAQSMAEKLGLNLPLDSLVDGLSAGVQQSVEMTRAFVSNPKLLILDEPTASLSEKEIVPFLDFVDGLRKKTDISVIFISHKLDEVFKIADRISVFVEGRKVTTLVKEDTSKEECIKLMLKGNVPAPLQGSQKPGKDAKVIFETSTLFYDGAEHKVSMCVKEGEVVGFFGLVGAGRSEFANAVYGRSGVKSGFITINGINVVPKNTSQMIKNGIIMTSELRINNMFKDDSLIRNVGLLHLDSFSKMGIVMEKPMEAFSLEVLKKNNVKFSNPRQRISTLSGGNIQKIIIGRSVVGKKMKLLILDEPTVGLDLGAKNDVYLKARSLALEENIGVIFISSEIEEIINVTDRVYVFFAGNIVSEFSREEYNEKTIMRAAFGGVE
jgi:ABC-type sugar transport system ATPase subunit